MKRDITVAQNFQGDVEKTLGWKPIPLFDRDHAQEVASMQVCVQYRVRQKRGTRFVKHYLGNVWNKIIAT